MLDRITGKNQTSCKELKPGLELCGFYFIIEEDHGLEAEFFKAHSWLKTVDPLLT